MKLNSNYVLPFLSQSTNIKHCMGEPASEISAETILCWNTAMFGALIYLLPTWHRNMVVYIFRRRWLSSASEYSGSYLVKMSDCGRKEKRLDSQITVPNIWYMNILRNLIFTKYWVVIDTNWIRAYPFHRNYFIEKNWFLSHNPHSNSPKIVKLPGSADVVDEK